MMKKIAQIMMTGFGIDINYLILSSNQLFKKKLRQKFI